MTLTGTRRWSALRFYDLEEETKPKFRGRASEMEPLVSLDLLPGELSCSKEVVSNTQTLQVESNRATTPQIFSLLSPLLAETDI